MEANHRIASHFILEANAASALNAPFPIQEDQVAQRYVLLHMQLVSKNHSAVATAVAHGQVLQRAFAAFVANGAVQRVAGEQKLNHVGACLFHRVGFGAYHHARAYLYGAACLQPAPKINLRRAVFVQQRLTSRPIAHWQTNLNQTHPAHAHRFQFGVVAKYGNVVPNLLGCIYNQCPLGNAHFHTIYTQCYEITHADPLPVRI